MLCRSCHHDLSPGDFYPGVASRCRDCHKAAMKLNRMTNPAVQRYDRERYRRPERKAMGAISAKRWRENHPQAYKAQTAVNNAIRDKRLTKGVCAFCAADKNVHAHHKDYSRPLDVVWLCAQCHHRLHATFPELGGHHEASK